MVPSCLPPTSLLWSIAMSELPRPSMIHLNNDDVLDLLSMRETMDALRIGFSQIASGEMSGERFLQSIRD